MFPDSITGTGFADNSTLELATLEHTLPRIAALQHG
jgi:hypothetical protein